MVRAFFSNLRSNRSRPCKLRAENHCHHEITFLSVRHARGDATEMGIRVTLNGQYIPPRATKLTILLKRPIDRPKRYLAVKIERPIGLLTKLGPLSRGSRGTVALLILQIALIIVAALRLKVLQSRDLRFQRRNANLAFPREFLLKRTRLLTVSETDD